MKSFAYFFLGIQDFLFCLSFNEIIFSHYKLHFRYSSVIKTYKNEKFISRVTRLLNFANHSKSNRGSPRITLLKNFPPYSIKKIHLFPNYAEELLVTFTVPMTCFIKHARSTTYMK